MIQFLIVWVITAVSLIITAFIVPGITVSSLFSAAVAAVVLGLVNAIVKPLLILFTLPLTILTLGLFLLVVNAIAFALVGYFSPGFTVDGFLPALLGSIVLSLISSLLNHFFGEA